MDGDKGNIDRDTRDTDMNGDMWVYMGTQPRMGTGRDMAMYGDVRGCTWRVTGGHGHG